MCCRNRSNPARKKTVSCGDYGIVSTYWGLIKEQRYLDAVWRQKRCLKQGDQAELSIAQGPRNLSELLFARVTRFLSSIVLTFTMGSPADDRANARPLLSGEVAWRDRYIMLESHGYRLRQRYHPDWKPSWLDTKKRLTHHEDYRTRNSFSTMDAVRISDGRKVFLKRIPTSSQELDILRFLSAPERLQDPDNHTAALLDEFTDDNDPCFTFIVMPLLRSYYYPDFSSVDEVVEFVKQLLRGLWYMHTNHVAHRDCSELNIMMNAEAMYPKGFHPATLTTDASGYKRAYPKRRRNVKDLQYYFIDFGISSKFGPDEIHSVVGVDGQDNEVPELSAKVPYDPFYTDVFILGNLFKKAFLKRYTNVGFLDPLVDQMTKRNWLDRCSSLEALQLFNMIVSEQSWYTLRWKLKERESGPITHFFQDVTSVSTESFYLVKTVLGSKSRDMTQFLLRRRRLNKD